MPVVRSGNETSVSGGSVQLEPVIDLFEAKVPPDREESESTESEQSETRPTWPPCSASPG
jgi:hypothetical protein